MILLSDLEGGRTGVPWPLEAIDCCTYGWIDGITKEDGKPCPMKVPEEWRTFRIGPEDYSELMGMGHRRASVRQIAHLEGTHGDCDVAYESALGVGYNIGDMSYAEVAWRLKDPRWFFLGRQAGIEDIWKSTLSTAAMLVEAFEQLFMETRIADARMVRDGKIDQGWSPPVFVEGGLHLVARVASEVARSCLYPVIALENCWIPDHLLIAPDSGAAVNRWGAGFDRARGRARSIPEIDKTVDYVDHHLARKSEQSWYAEAYPWKEFPTSAKNEAWFNFQVRQAERKGKTVILHLGQVPYDASITMDGDCLTECDIMEMVADVRQPKNVMYLYRPHPMEEPSTFTGMTSTDRIRDYAGDFPWYHFEVIPSEEVPISAHYPELPDEPARNVVVVTVNSQAGLELSRWYPVRTYGRAFYDISGLTHKTPFETTEPPAHRRTRWATYVGWLLERHYMLKEQFIPELDEYVMRALHQGFGFFDPPRGF